ncbi:hypothetical protein [Mycolicibacterium peregrinum]|uniref:hypothetical protein n=1 Tax=Mycolicibacterium peregrinum TaxID=43304 RepID=UPI0010423FC3|nr:hypothetical protein [Mycolicibacterium peregrinum]
MSIRDEDPTANRGTHLSAGLPFNDKLTLTSIDSRQFDCPAVENLRRSMRAILRRCGGPTAVDRDSSKQHLDHDLWRAIAGALVSAGLGAVESRRFTRRDWELLSAAAAEFGAVPVDVPFLTSSVVAATIARRVGQPALATRLARGANTAALLTPYEQPIRPASLGSMHAGRVWAFVPGVAGARQAETLMILCGDKLVSFDREWAEMSTAASVDGTRELVNVKVDGVHATVLAEGERALHAVAAAADAAGAVLAAEQAGLAARCLQLSAHTGGAPHQHGGDREMVAVEKADAAARYAGDCLVAEDPHVGIAVSTAQVVCATVSFRVARMAAKSAQTSSHTTALLLERARGNALAFGGPLWHRRRLAQLSTAPIPVENPCYRRSR